MENYLNEAFRRLSLVEDDFDMTSRDKNKIDELKSFISDDVKVKEEPVEEIIDVNADTEADLADSYVGKVILECSCCHSRVYKDEDEVVIDNESELANMEDACPVCNNTFGYNIIGKIENFEPEEKAEEEEIDVEDSKAYKTKDDIEDEKAFPADDVEIKDDEKDEAEEDEFDEDESEEDGSEDEDESNEDGEDREKDESLNEAANSKHYICDNCGFEADLTDDEYNGSCPNCRRHHGEFLPIEDDIDEGVNNKTCRKPGAKGVSAKCYSHRYRHELEEGKLGDFANKVYKATQSPIAPLVNKAIRNILPLEDVDDETLNKLIVDIDGDFTRNKKPIYGVETFIDELISRLGAMGYDIKDFDEEDFDDEDFDDEDFDEGLKEGCKLKESVELKADGEDSVQVTKDDEGKMNITIGGAGGTDAEVEDLGTSGEGESIVPLTDEDKDSIKNNSAEEVSEEEPTEEIEEVAEEEPAEETEEAEEEPAEENKEESLKLSGKRISESKDDKDDEDCEDCDIDDFDTDKFDKLAEKFIHKTYGNVSGYKSTSIKDFGNNIVVEGVISYKSGAERNTKFVFTEGRATKTGKVIFEGYNTTFSEKKAAFKVRGILNNSNYIAESFHYNYTVGRLNESNKSETVKVCGVIKL